MRLKQPEICHDADHGWVHAHLEKIRKGAPEGQYIDFDGFSAVNHNLCTVKQGSWESKGHLTGGA
jgi:hypothetical protein